MAEQDLLFVAAGHLIEKTAPAGTITKHRRKAHEDLAHINEICAQFDCDPANLIAIMQEIQAAYKYLSEQALTRVAENLHIGTAKVYSVATFYENFSLEAKGKHVIKVCAGTACHVRKSRPIYDAVHDYLGLTGKKKTSGGRPFHPGDRGLPGAPAAWRRS